MKNWVVILVSPKGALNVGSIARLMGNFGLRELRLVDPRFDRMSQDCKQMAMHDHHLVKNAKDFSTLAEAISDLTLTIAFSGRVPHVNRPSAHLYEVQDKILPKISATDRVGLVFGREEIGLLLEELCLLHWQVEIPTDPDHFSLNLSMAAAISMSWLFQTTGSWQPRPSEKPEYARPTHQEQQIFYNRIHNLMEAARFHNKENPQLLRDDLWGMLNRADLDERELRILFGMLTAVETLVSRSKNLQ